MLYGIHVHISAALLFVFIAAVSQENITAIRIMDRVYS